MTVASGQAPYEYVPSVADSTFHFNVVLGAKVAPSSVLFEEAMFVLKAEYNRIGATADVFSSTTMDNDGFRFFLSDNAEALFDPHPSGWYLQGTLPVEITTSAGGSYTSFNQPATYNMRAYMKDMREVLREIFAEIAANAGGGDLTHFTVASGWLGAYKGRLDNVFYLEDEGPDNVLHSSGTHPDLGDNTNNWDRYLDEVRYQPMPYMSGFGGGINFEFKTEQTVVPFRPAFHRLDGSLAPLWNQSEIYGDVFVNTIAVAISGGNSSGTGGDVHIIDVQGGLDEDIPTSGNYTPADSAAEGVYLAYIISSGTALGTGLAPWGSGIDFPRHVRVPHSNTNLPQSGGSQYAVYITDNVTALQANTDQTSIAESGHGWWRPLERSMDTIDLYVTTPADSGSRRKWGNEFYSKVQSDAGTLDLYRPGGYFYDRGNNQWIRPGSSGFASAHTNYPFGTGVITTWEPELSLKTAQFCGSLTESIDSIVFAVLGLESIIDDGTDLLVNGFIQEDGVAGASGALIKMDSSFNMTDAIVSGYKKGRLFWHRGTSEYLYLSTSGSARRTLEEMPNRHWASGMYHVATLSWGEFTGPREGTIDLVHHVPTFKANSSPSSMFGGDGHHVWIRTVALWNDEGTDDLYGMVLAFPSGTTPAAATVMSRYVVKFDDSSHPYVFDEAWLIGAEDSRDNFDFSMRNNAKWSFFAEDFQY